MMEAIRENRALSFLCLWAVLGWRAQGDAAENTQKTIHLVSSMEFYQQKMTKEFLQVAYGMNASKNRKYMVDTIGTFDMALNTLETGDAASSIIAPPNEGVFQEIRALKPKWAAYKDLLERTYNTILIWHKGYIASEASDPGLVEAILAFKRGWNLFADTDAARRSGLQAAYITNNPYPIGNRDGLDFANGSEEYHQIHKDFHPKYRGILYARDYYDIFMFDLEGNLIYSVYKELDYATNFASSGAGEWKDSGLGEAYEEALANPDIITVIDWKPYGPSSGALASFLSTGIKQNGILLGVFCTQLPPAARPKDPAEWLRIQKDSISKTAADSALPAAMEKFKQAWDSFAPSDEERLSGLQSAYITNNPYPLGEKDKLNFSSGGEAYHSVHEEYHPRYRGILYAENYYDIFMLDMEGNLVYSVYKELDYATNFAAAGSGKWKDSGLGEAFEKAKSNPDVISVVDWKPYGPSNGALASFLSTGIKKHGVLIGIFCTQMPPEARMTQVLDLGEIERENVGLLGSVQMLRDRYVSHATLEGTELAPVAQTRAQSQLLIIQQIMKETLFAILEVKRTEYLEAMQLSEETFQDIHTALLWGDMVAGLPPLTNICTLHSMLNVGKQIHKLHKYLKLLRDSKAIGVSRELLSNIVFAEYDLRAAMEDAVNFFRIDDGVDPAAEVAKHTSYTATDASDPELADAIIAFKEAWNSFGADDAERLSGLQSAYITNNQHPAGSKDQLDFADGSEDYHKVHKKYHPKYRSILYERNYYDIFMLDLEGNLIYSVYKELDYATNFAMDGTGQWKDSGLGEAYEAARETPDRITVIDWKPYGPSAGALASFLSTGIRKSGELVGVFATQLPPGAKPICTVFNTISAQGWSDAIAELSDQRMLLSKVTRMYLQVLKGVDVQASTIAFVLGAGEATSSLRKTLKGDSSIPAPPTQGIANVLKRAWNQWKLLEDEMKVSLDSNDKSYKTLSKIMGFSKAVDSDLSSAVEQYVLAAVTAQPTLRSAIWGVSQRQISLLQRMMVEVLFLSLGINVETNTAVFKESVAAFEVSHWELLKGRRYPAQAVGSFLPDLLFPGTSNACALDAMLDVMNKFSMMKTSLQQVIAGNSTAIHQADLLSATVIDAMTATLSFYKTDSGSCTLDRSDTAWEVALDRLSQLPYLFYKVESEFALVESGLSQTWLNKAAVDLTNHRGFIRTEAGDPKLIDAFQSFKRGWDSFRPTDAERVLSLQVAYITLNEHPAGSKDQLDFAPGPEEYHAAHKQYHPIYRDILYARNYYDIFMLDLKGNCIYSVYKELDYATNFAANGTGEWKDSGLGEAFEAAVRNPDVISVIDWKPYGPSFGALASFLSTGIKPWGGELIGVFCTQMPPESKPINSTEVLEQTIQTIHDEIYYFVYGKTDQGIYPPATQAISDSLRDVLSVWVDLEPIAEGPRVPQSLAAIVSQSASVSSSSHALIDALVDGAWKVAPALQGSKIVLAGKNLALLQSMCRDSVLLTKNGFNVTRAAIAASMSDFEANQKLLLEGGKVRRLAAKTDVAETTAPAALELLKTVDERWSALKPHLEEVTPQATEILLRSVVESTAAAAESMEAVVTYFGSTTRTTTMMSLEILAPIPFTGDWQGGQTLRLAAQLAEGLINEEQRILPGFKLKHVFRDDHCDATKGSQIVLGEMSAKDSYIALGGAGCSKVCAQEASVASSIRLPFLSYECPSDFDPQLSDTNAYPDLARIGTVTTPVVDIIRNLGNTWGWDRIIIVSGDQSKYKALADERRSKFEGLGFRSDYKAVEEDDWKHIKAVMSDIRESTKGMNRVVFFIGTEKLFRKIICASITQGLQKGITWLTDGTWRHEWWTKTDQSTPQHRQWLAEDVSGNQLKTAFAEFKQSWDAYDLDVVVARAALQKKYATDQKDALISVEGAESYHDTHRKWHTVYRKILYDRGYYDIFFFDTKGDMIYSVYKESDYATNFKATGNGPWKDSGLGNAFEAVMASPDEVHYIDWKPYGPSGDAPAAFFATGVKDSEGVLVGVYSIQLPPEFERSIEELEPQCELQAIAEAFAGAVNVAGLGRPTDENLEKPLGCFKSHSAMSLSRLIDEHFRTGYPAGNTANRVADPYFDIKFHAVDATCAIAKTVEHLYKTKGYSIQQIQRPNDEVYAEFTRYMKNELDFQGASGRVKFSGNNRPNVLVVKQVLEGKEVEVGLLHLNGTLSWIGNGTSDASWAKEPADPPDAFKYWLVFQIGIPAVVFVCACVVGIHLGLQHARSKSGTSKSTEKKNTFQQSKKTSEDPSIIGVNIQEVEVEV